MKEKWIASEISHALIYQVFSRGALMVLPNTYWTGNECDLLVVADNLKIIDVEIKISRSDFRADAKKQKWYHAFDFSAGARWFPGAKGAPREWPPNVWKHFYVLPKSIYSDDLLDGISPASGVMTMRRISDGGLVIDVVRSSRANRAAEKISAADAIGLARLASLRMVDALHTLRERRYSYSPTGDVLEIERDSA